MTRLFALILALLFTLSVGTRSEASDEQDDPDTVYAVPYLYEKFAAWRERLIIDEVTVNETSILQIDILVDSSEDYGFDFTPFLLALDQELVSGTLPFKRLHIDLLQKNGKRLEGVDLNMSDFSTERAVFDVDDEPTVSGDSQPIVDQALVFSTFEVRFEQYALLSDSDGTFIHVWFTFVNDSKEAISAAEALFVSAHQGNIDTPLEQHFSLKDDLETTFMDISSGEQIVHASVAFYLTSETENVDLTFSAIGDDETKSVSLPIADSIP